jgi:hypothetical protein
MCCGDHLLRWPFRYGTTKTMSWQVGAASTRARSRDVVGRLFLLQLYAPLQIRHAGQSA